MKTLLLMRHAQATWGDDPWPDFDRPLNPRGVADAPQMGRRLVQAGFSPDAIIASSARRTQQTAALVAGELGLEHRIEARADLYLCPVSVWVDFVNRLSHDWECVLCIGHNNGLEEIVSDLQGRHTPMPPAGLAVVELDVWTGFSRTIQPARIAIWLPE